MDSCDGVSRAGVNPRKRGRESVFSLCRRLESVVLKYFGANDRAMMHDTPQS